MNCANHYYHSADGQKMGAEPVWFNLTLDGRNAVSIFVQLECGANIAGKMALMQFDTGDASFPGHELGMARSNHPGIGWFRYLSTQPGSAHTRFTLVPPPGFSGSIRVGIRTWWENDRVVLKSFMALPDSDPQALCASYLPLRNTERYRVRTWSSLTEFLCADEIGNGMHTIAMDDLLLDFYLLARPDSPLLCFLHGNAPRPDSHMMPILSGWAVTRGVPASVLMFSDPALLLDRKLQLAWHAGTRSVSTQYAYQLILEKIKAELVPSHLVFWGGSGGGFASLYLSAVFPGSTAFVWNPQTSILRYEEEAVAQFGKTCFSCGHLEDLPAVLDGRVVSDVASAFLHADNTVIYLQNASDWHAKAHLLPFLSKLNAALPAPAYSGWITERLYLHLGDFSDGHSPPSKHVIARLLHALAETDARELDIQCLIEDASRLDDAEAAVNHS